MSKIVYAHPSYGALDPVIEKAGRVAIMQTAKTHEFLGDVSTIRRGWVDGRNAAAKDAVDSDADYILWHDDDVLLTNPEVWSRLLRYDEHFVTGVIFQKLEPFYPLIYGWREEKKGFSPYEEWPENTFLPVDGCGFGICVTSTELLRKIQKLPSFEENGWFNPIPSGRKEPFSEDLSFCLRAKEAGVQLYADTAVVLEHQIGPQFATVANYKAAAAARKVLNGIV